ncbi:MBL fold metallo-hydrolase [uncultured Vibrio sp.]|uniref:MBL fold metallo-hydrolase n=1 Tax=uncultured Vibrio sp. TaxID=114054 RepID=UPI00091A0CC6|nr:MBL fold metallo-hydrolase [uncultured Vibrio sp.]OIQ26775.1 MAG: Zn-dependent hydrolase [Vibrio sp. MedPE-SWchi]
MKLHTLKGYIQAIYLVEYPDKLMLLDGASRADISKIKDFIQVDLQRPLSDLKLVVVTHMHPDHAGAAHLLRKQIGCQIASSNKEKDWYSGFDGIAMHWTDLALAKWMANRMGSKKSALWYPRQLNPDYRLSDGDSIPHFEDWQVFDTPGHTDRDLSVYHRESKTVYVGDLMVEVKKRLIAPFPIFHPNQYRESVKRIYKLDCHSVLAAHGGEVVFDHDAYQHLIDTAPRRPITHWRVTKIKLKGVGRAILATLFLKRKH